MLKLQVIHYQPLELFPPALNFIRFLSNRSKTSVSVSTTRRENQVHQVNPPESVELRVTNVPGQASSTRISRALGYLRFAADTTRQLKSNRPGAVVYFDPYSALPGLLYKLLFDRKVTLWIHFHEYFEPGWYKNGMALARFVHLLERKFGFMAAAGISQTNSKRVELFLKDHPGVDSGKLHVFPNFPPPSWEKHRRRVDAWTRPTKFVALGSFTLKGTYIGEFCDWLERQNGAASLDIYSLYFDQETKDYLQNRNSKWIRFHDQGVPYDQIPALFEKEAYHVGLVLYRCNHINTVNCVSNKVFEYLVCGLDVWYPKQMVATNEFSTRGTFPKVLPVDYNALEAMDLSASIMRQGHRYDPMSFDCTAVYSRWADLLDRAA